VRADKKTPLKADKKVPPRGHKRGVIGYSKKSALLEDAITQMNAGKYGRSSAALKELLALDPSNMEARRLFATLHLRLGSRLPARQAFESLANEALERQDYWLAESLLREYLAAGPRCVPFIEKLGSVYQEKGDVLAASEEFAKAIDILIEDPDPDRPALPAELYAKIRELAPASPPAFRLASLFDAQTGELIARPATAPNPNQEEVSASSVAVESLGSATPNLSTIPTDSVSGVMPWDAVPAGISELPAQSSQSENPDEIAISPEARLEQAVELSVASIAPPLVEEALVTQTVPNDQDPVELDPSPSLPLPVSDSDNSASIVVHDREPISVPSVHEEFSGSTSVASDSERGVSSLPRPQDFESTISGGSTHVVETTQPIQSDTSNTFPILMTKALSAPLPWEQVQETTVAIPQPDEESLSVTGQGAEAIPASSQEVSPIKTVFSERSEEEPKEESSLLDGIETIPSPATTEEYSPDVAWSAPDVVATEPTSSSLPASEESSQAISASGQLTPEGLAEVVCSPMPWEQIQESSVSTEGLTRESVDLTGVIPDSFPIESQEALHDEGSDRLTAEAIVTSPELGSSESHDAVSVPTGSELSPSENLTVPEPSPKNGQFSWASIFNSAWKFGSSSPAPHDSFSDSLPVEPSERAESVMPSEVVGTASLHKEPLSAVSPDTISESMPMSVEQIQDAPVTISFTDSASSVPGEFLEGDTGASIELSEEVVAPEVPADAPIFKDEQTYLVNSEKIVESVPVSVSLAESAPLSIVGDQVQETPAPISPADLPIGSTDSLVEPLAMPVASSEVLDETAAREGPQIIAPVEAAALSTDVLIEEPQSLEVDHGESEETLFRFKDSTCVEEKSTAGGEAFQAQHPTLPDEPSADPQPTVSSLQADDRTPIHSEEFRIVSQVEPPPVAQESVNLDMPVSNAEPALTISSSSKSIPPVLPHELLPVLQTLVDQLSVVTKTIPAISAEAQSADLLSRDQEIVPEVAFLREPSQAPISVEPVANFSSAQISPVEESSLLQEQAGEVALQTRRSSDQEQQPSIEPVSETSAVIPPCDDLPAASVDPVSPSAVETAMQAPPTAQDKEEWIRTGEAIRFVDQKTTEPTHPSPPPPVVQEEWRAAPSALSPAASAVDVLFQSSGLHTRTQTIDRTAVSNPRPRLSAKLARVRIGLSVFIGSCFSTTHALVTSIVGLAVLSLAIVAIAIGVVGLIWLVMEERPSPAFQSLTTPPQRAMMDSSKNGYLLLLGFEADATADPVQMGHERKPDGKDAGRAAVCQGGDEGVTGANQKNASASVVQGWYRSADPAGQFTAQANSLKDWTSQANMSLGRYRQWLKMPFEDWGHGQAVTPPCAAILFAHRLHVAEGFSQEGSTEAGVERLEGDLEAWRTTLGQAKTLPVKMMALQAINDDIAVASGLLVKPDFDGKVLPRISKMLRPLDPVESSMRWPMQSQLALAVESYESHLDADRGEDVPLHVSVAGMLPLPKQRRFNNYAEYYESSYKAAGEGRYGAMPKRTTYVQHPANGVMDYLINPIENIIGIDPLPEWDHYNGLVIDTDAHLRLASLQAWLRRGPQDADLLARIAKAGQRFYDPYTGLPMLVNLKRGVMYSVGHDGKDQDADLQQDVVVSIPVNQPAIAIAKPAPKSK